ETPKDRLPPYVRPIHIRVKLFLLDTLDHSPEELTPQSVKGAIRDSTPTQTFLGLEILLLRREPLLQETFPEITPRTLEGENQASTHTNPASTDATQNQQEDAIKFPLDKYGWRNKITEMIPPITVGRPLNPQDLFVTPERIPASQRLGPMSEPTSVLNRLGPLPPQQVNEDIPLSMEPAKKRNPGRPPGRRVTPLPLSITNGGIRKRRVTKASPPPRQRNLKSLKTIPRNEE
ncbi:hypothetical protein HID58_031188, partial [Brassica napus]